MSVTVERVKRDLEARQARGLSKYGVSLDRTDLSEHDWLEHLYEELLDAACYVRRLLDKLE